MINLLISFVLVFSTPLESFYPTKMVFPDKVVYTSTTQLDIFQHRIVLKDTYTYFQKTFYIEKHHPDATNDLYLCKNGYLIEIHRYQNREIRKITISNDESTLTLLKAIET